MTETLENTIECVALAVSCLQQIGGNMLDFSAMQCAPRFDD